MTRCSYLIDADDRIRHVDEGWIAFARENAGSAGERILPPAILGQPLLSSITDATTRSIWRALLARVRKAAAPSRFRFRCDSPGMRRLLEMTITPGAGGSIEFTTTVVLAERRMAVALLDPAVERTDELLTTCAWCARVRCHDDEWCDLEEGVQRLNLFDRDALPRLSHGMCPSCLTAMEAEIAEGPRPHGDVTTLGPFEPGRAVD